jgi:hypothetical protein
MLLGSVLVAASEKGVCAIFLGNDPNALAKDLQDKFPKAHMIGGDEKFERTVVGQTVVCLYYCHALLLGCRRGFGKFNIPQGFGGPLRPKLNSADERRHVQSTERGNN